MFSFIHIIHLNKCKTFRNELMKHAHKGTAINETCPKLLIHVHSVLYRRLAILRIKTPNKVEKSIKSIQAILIKGLCISLRSSFIGDDRTLWSHSLS